MECSCQFHCAFIAPSLLLWQYFKNSFSMQQKSSPTSGVSVQEHCFQETSTVSIEEKPIKFKYKPNIQQNKSTVRGVESFTHAGNKSLVFIMAHELCIYTPLHEMLIFWFGLFPPHAIYFLLTAYKFSRILQTHQQIPHALI